MMNISSQDISDFLAQHKTISLEKIGLLDLNSKESEDVFTYNKQAETSPEFLQYLSEKTGKSLSIIKQDAEYFLDQTRQLMNIRASNLLLNNIGYIYASNTGIYAFSSDSSETVKQADRKAFEDMYAQSPLTSSVNYTTKRNRKPWRIIAAVVIIGAAIAYGAYYVHNSPTIFSDSGDSAKIATDSSKSNTQTTKPEDKPAASVTPPKPKDFKFIIQTFTDVLECQKRQQQLRNYGNIVERDTVTVNGQPQYRLFVNNLSTSPTDTTRIKDSLHTYFGYPVSVE